MKIGIIVAMDKELQQLKHLFDAHDVVVEKCGIGKVNAALGAAEMIQRHHPDVIISSGCAGGNGDDIEVKDVVAGAEVAYHDVYCGTSIDNSTVYGQVQGMPARYLANQKLLEKACQLKCEGVGVHPGLIVTGDWFVDSKDKMRDIIAHFPEAKAVDMESAAIAQTCYKYGVPFISFRVVSDIPLRDTNAAMYHDFWNSIAENSFQVTKTFVESILE